MQGNDWKEDAFSWIETTYKFRENSYSTDLLIDFSIGTDIKNSSWRVIDIDQASISDLLISAFAFDFIVWADIIMNHDGNNFYWVLIYPNQASLGQAQTYLSKGLSERTVSAYYKYMVNVAVLLGAERSLPSLTNNSHVSGRWQSVS